jgi:hypothetical protein
VLAKHCSCESKPILVLKKKKAAEGVSLPF